MNEKKDKYIEIIKYINEVSVSKTCKSLDVDYSNVISGRASSNNIKKVYESLIIQILEVIENATNTL